MSCDEQLTYEERWSERLARKPSSHDMGDAQAAPPTAQPEAPTTAQLIVSVCAEVQDMLIEKNAAYGDSALRPLRVFSHADTREQLLVRLDDKLSRIARGREYADDDTVLDLIGYLILLRVYEKL